MTADTGVPMLDRYPALTDVDPPLSSVRERLVPVDVPAGAVLFDEGTPCRGFPLVLDGEVRVSRIAPDGRSLELYRVLPGELCLVSAACLFRHQPMSARGVATKPSRLAVIAPDLFSRWLDTRSFRDEILGLFAERMADLTTLVDAVAFQRLDQRLAAALLGHGTQWRVTHQAVAEQLGTVREIVTRLLRRFEAEGWIALGRERIEIRDAAALRSVATAAGSAAPPA
ncbi:MAG: Crp/Fnr family transcriptional regulator [Lautropia sp.]